MQILTQASLSLMKVILEHAAYEANEGEEPPEKLPFWASKKEAGKFSLKL
jgi:hypothetical protein